MLYTKTKTKAKKKKKKQQQQRDTGICSICVSPVYFNLVIIFYKNINRCNLHFWILYSYWILRAFDH